MLFHVGFDSGVIVQQEAKINGTVLESIFLFNLLSMGSCRRIEECKR